MTDYGTRYRQSWISYENWRHFPDYLKAPDILAYLILLNVVLAVLWLV